MVTSGLDRWSPLPRFIGGLQNPAYRPTWSHTVRREDADLDYPKSVDAFEVYRQALLRRDIESTTRERYLQIAGFFKAWLGKQHPTIALAQDFLAELRDHGYRQRSIILYYHVLRQLLATQGELLNLRLRRPHDLPKWFDRGDTERLLAQAQTGIRAQKPWQKKRNYALILAPRDAGLRKGEAVGLRVADVDFRRRTIRVTGKGARERVIPMTQRLLVALWEACEGKMLPTLYLDLATEVFTG